jgi:hypothetical protein
MSSCFFAVYIMEAFECSAVIFLESALSSSSIDRRRLPPLYRLAHPPLSPVVAVSSVVVVPVVVFGVVVVGVVVVGGVVVVVIVVVDVIVVLGVVPSSFSLLPSPPYLTTFLALPFPPSQEVIAGYTRFLSPTERLGD